MSNFFDEPRPFVRARDAGYRPTDEEAAYASYAHWIAALVALLSAGVVLPILAPWIVLFLVRDKGPFVVYHVNQAMAFQLVMLIVAIVVAVPLMTIAFCTLGFGAVLFPLLFVPAIVAVIVPIFVALATRGGEWKPYPFIGERVLAAERAHIR